MITVTTDARAAGSASAATQSGADELGLRIAARRDEQGALHYAMGFDEARGDDIVVPAEGIALVCRRGHRELLEGMTLDYVELEAGDFRFIFINPNDVPAATPTPAATGCGVAAAAAACGPLRRRHGQDSHPARARRARTAIRPARRRAARGEVYLVGAGPGDPDLLTMRALKLMQRADVVLYDNLVSAEVLALLPAATERVYVGKQRANHTMRQEDINALLVRARARRQARAAAQGRRSVRLRPRRRGDRHAVRGGRPLRGRAGHHRGARRRRVRGHPAHASRPRAVLRVRRPGT